MMKYSEQSYTSNSVSSEVEDSIGVSPIEQENKLSLTPLWEYVIRAKCLPESLDLNAFFETIHNRLHNPEWEVRQHALRVLVDFIPLIPIDELDVKIGLVLNDLVTNLGHLGPAVRKGAVDSLRAYVNRTTSADDVLTDLVERGVEKAQENKVATNVVLGIILSLPYLLNTKLKSTTIAYIVHRLLDKIVKVIHQETVLRALLRIREIIGHDRFDEYLATHKTYNSKKEFELLCQVYDLHTYKSNKFKDERHVTLYKSEDVIELDRNINLKEDKVILETEIQLDSGSAITMKIHEENNNNSEQNRNTTFKILPDESETEDYELLRRTPRRVRFGGEIVKLRTPDSDSNQQSDENDATISIISDGDKPIIEIKYIENETKTTTRTSRSLIPVPIKHTQSAPNSPRRTNLQKRTFYKSSPNISKTKKLTPKIYGKSRIPRRFNTEVHKSIETKIQIKITETPKLKNKPATKLKKLKLDKPIQIIRRNSRDGEFSPTPVHNEIEVLHNLTRSPSPRRHETFKLPEINKREASNEQTACASFVKPRKLQSAQIIAQPKFVELRKPQTADNESPWKKRNEKFFIKPNRNFDNFASFHIFSKSEEFYDFADSPIPTKDSGDCLTCSSSGSDIEKKGIDFGVLDNRIVDDLQNSDDIFARQRGLEELLRVIQNKTVLDSLQDRLPSLLYILFTAEQNQLLQPTAEQALSTVFSKMNEQMLITRLHQIALNLSKMGSPLGVRLAILLMRRIPPGLLVDQLLADPILGAKSSKIREGALQILMTISRIFPSTDLNVPKSIKSIVPLLKDRKRKVRQAALETLAALAQLSSPGMVLEIANDHTQNCTESEQIMKVVRTRLSRKQLPTVNMNGSIRYSTPTGESEIEWLARGSGSPRNSTKPLIEENQEKERRFSIYQKDITNEQTISQTIRASASSEQNSRRFSLQLANERKEEIMESSFERSSTEGGEVDKGSVVAENDFGESVRSDRGAPKINYWQRNSQRLNKGGRDGESDWSKESGEDPSTRNPSTQIWAIDPSAFNTSEKLSTSNGTLRQVYVVKPNESRTVSTNTPPQVYREDATNTSPIRKKTSRGRSFSPPRSDYDSFDDLERERFVRRGYQREVLRIRREERIRKSFSSEHLVGPERLRKESTFSSGSSSGSSVRQTGNWHRDPRSGIPVPIFTDSKLKIKNRPNYKAKGPMTIPYFPPVKSPSPPTTPEKFKTPEEPQIIRQPFSSGSESSGYFTPPPENATAEASPERTPRQTSPNPARFIQIDSPKHSDLGEVEENNDYDDSLKPDEESLHDSSQHEIETQSIEDEKSDTEPTVNDKSENEKSDYDEKTEDEKSEKSSQSTPVFARKSTELNTIGDVNNFNLSHEISNSLDETDFTQITFSEKRALSKSEVDIKISTHITRKNINSAPSLNKFDNIDDIPIKTSLPGSIADSLDDTEAPEELFQNQTPKKPVRKITTLKSSVRRKSCRLSNANVELYPDNLRPFSKPKEALSEVLSQLDSPEWETTMKGLQSLVRLVRHHKEYVEGQMHNVCVLLGKQVRNLRSQVARAACKVATELFGSSRRPIEIELDELAFPLLHRTADTNKFLRADANSALDEMCLKLSVPKVISVVVNRGCNHQNAMVRCASARLLANIVNRLGAEKVFQLPRDTRDKILSAGANLLMEGSLETRKHSKMMLGQLASHCQFSKALTEAVPSSILRHIDKTLKSLT